MVEKSQDATWHICRCTGLRVHHVCVFPFKLGDHHAFEQLRKILGLIPYVLIYFPKFALILIGNQPMWMRIDDMTSFGHMACFYLMDDVEDDSFFS